MDLYPLFLRLRDRRVLVVGGGTVGARKARELVDAGAQVVVVAKETTLEGVEVHRRAFIESDLDGVWLVIAATNDPAVNRVVAEAASRRQIFVNAVDDPPNASAFFGAVIRRAPFLVAISSTGELPALSRLIREMIDAALPSDDWIARARALRRAWKANNTPMNERFAQLVAEIKSV